MGVHMKWVWVVLFFSVPLLAWQGPIQDDSVQSKQDWEWEFVGCRPTVSECRYSCPSHRGYAWKITKELCPDEWQEKVACFCRKDDDATEVP